MDAQSFRDVTFDLGSLTLGEAAEAERQSGWALTELVASRTSRRMLAVFVDGLRRSESYALAPSWRELSELRLLDVSSSTSPEPSASPSETSSD